MNDKTLALLVGCIRGLVCVLLLTLIGAVIYGGIAFGYYSQSWRSEMTSKAYATTTINNAKADREAELIKSGQLPFCAVSYDGCGSDHPPQSDVLKVDLN